MDITTSILEDLKQILINLKKAPHRKYRRSTLVEKLRVVGKLYDELLKESNNLDDQIQIAAVTKARELVFEIRTFITNTLKFKSLPSFSTIVNVISCFQKSLNSIRLSKMAKVDIKLGTSLVSTYDGNPEGLDSFVDSVNLFSELTFQENVSATSAVQETAKGLVARFVKTRLKGIAHQAVVSCTTVEEIITNVKAQCDTKENSDSLSLKLKSIKQKGSISEFCTEIENMCVLLKNAYIKETIPAPKAQEMATKVGIASLISNVRDNNTKIILKAGTFTTVNQAVQKVLANNTDQGENSNVYYYAHNHNNYAPNNGRYGRNKDYYGQQDFRGRGTNRNYYTRPNFDRNYSQSRSNNKFSNVPNYDRNYSHNRSNNNFSNMPNSRGRYQNIQSNRGNGNVNRQRGGGPRTNNSNNSRNLMVVNASNEGQDDEVFFQSGREPSLQ